MGCQVIIHNKATTRKSKDKRGWEGYYVGLAPNHYLCFTLINEQTNTIILADTVEFLHYYLSHP